MTLVWCDIMLYLYTYLYKEKGETPNGRTGSVASNNALVAGSYSLDPEIFSCRLVMYVQYLAY